MKLLRAVASAVLLAASCAAMSQLVKRDAAAGARTPASAPFEVRIFEGAEDRASREERERLTDAREASSLNAAERAARAAEDQAQLGWWSFALSAIGAAGLLITIVLTRRSVREAARAADAAIDSARAADVALKLAQDTAERQLRAYVGIETIEWNGEGIPHDGRIIFPEPLTVWITAKNAGQTPAHGLEFEVSFIETPIDGLPSDFDYVKIERTPYQNISLGPSIPGLGPGNSCLQTVQLNYEEMLALARATDGKSRFYIFGQVSYMDAFEKGRVSQFCVQAIGPSSRPRQARFTFFGPHNRTT